MDLKEHTLAGITEVSGTTATLFNDASTFSGFAFLFFLQLFSGFLAEQQPELLLSFWCHETLLGLLGLGSFFHTLAYFSTLAFNFGLFSLLSLIYYKKKKKNYFLKYYCQ